MNLSTNTMRYGFDTFKFAKSGYIEAKTALNCEGVTNVEGFNIEGVQPADTNRAVCFKIDDVYYKLNIANGIATLSELPTQEITTESVLEEGNTVAELATVTAVNGFVGKQIFPVIALFAENDVVTMPTLKLELKTRTNKDQFQKEELSAEYELYETDIDIVSITPEIETKGLANVDIQCSLKQNNEWSGYMPLLTAKGQKASAIKYKATYSVTKLDGSDTAKINKVVCIYRKGNAYVSGTTAELMTVTQDYENPLSYVRCHVVHDALRDAKIKAFISFREKPKQREMINLGVGNNDRQLIQLEDTNINHNKLQVFFDGKPVFDYDFNIELSQILFTASEGVIVTASYEYGWEKEEWQEMIFDDCQRNLKTGLYETSYIYELPSELTNKTISVVKLELTRPEGHETDEILGIGNGKTQMYVLPHYAKIETITSDCQFSYDEDSRIIKIIGAKDEEIKVSYDWQSETQKITGLVTAWNE